MPACKLLYVVPHTYAKAAIIAKCLVLWGSAERLEQNSSQPLLWLVQF
jgi:hypothetical protein